MTIKEAVKVDPYRFNDESSSDDQETRRTAPHSSRNPITKLTSAAASKEVLETYKKYKSYMQDPKFKQFDPKSTINSSQFTLSPGTRLDMKE